MTTIDSLSTQVSLSGADKVLIYSPAARDARTVTASDLAEYVRDTIEGGDDSTIYNLTISNGGFSTVAQPSAPGASVWVLIELSGPAATGTITLPTIDNRAPGQEVLVTCSQSVGVLAVVGGDAQVRGAPAALVANGFFRVRYDNISNKWIRVG